MTYLTLALLVLTLNPAWSDKTRPNVVVILADDLGYGDVSIFGNKAVETSNIDSICHSGARLDHHVASAPLCTPSRAAFLTGRYAARMGLEGSEGTQRVITYASGRAGLPANETTWATVLKRHGYSTAAIGKWHVGWDDTWPGDQQHGPLGHGFDYFFGLPFTLVYGFELDRPFLTFSAWSRDAILHGNHVAAAIVSFLFIVAMYSGRGFRWLFIIALIIMLFLTWLAIEHFTFHKPAWWQRSLFMEKYLNSHLMEDREVFEQPIRLERLTPQLTERAVAFLKSAPQPFALYFALPNVHTPFVVGDWARGKSKAGPYGDSVLEMDLAVGQVMTALDDLGLANDTIVYFTSDHGAQIDNWDEIGSNGPFKGGKSMGAVEGGVRVPACVRWPGRVAAHSVVAAPTSLLDWRPTLSHILQENNSQELDGQSVLQLLLGTQKKSSPRVFRHYCGTSLHGMRIVDESGAVFKAYFREPRRNRAGHCGYNGLCPCFGPGVIQHKNPVIYDLDNDPYENTPLQVGSERYNSLASSFEKQRSLAEAEWLPESQFVSPWNVMPRPWTQPCARFPLCTTN